VSDINERCYGYEPAASQLYNLQSEIERLRAELLNVLPALRAADGALHWARSHKETGTLAAAHEKIRAAITAVKWAGA
jgi:hypothetical protein